MPGDVVSDRIAAVTMSFGGMLTPRPQAPRPSWFVELARLTVEGAGAEDRVEGLVRARVEDDGGTTFRYRVARRGDLVRCTALSGGVHLIAGPTTVWRRREDEPAITARPRTDHVATPDDYEFGCSRPDEDRWRGDDFTVPTGPATEVRCLDRRAWLVELAPPPHKPYPLSLTIDADTGLVLRQSNEHFGTYHEWIELDTDADPPDDLFTWRDADYPARRYE